jgi:hypothetical protein
MNACCVDFAVCEECASPCGASRPIKDEGRLAVRLIPAQFVKPYRKSNKNDFLDAEAIAEAVTKQNMRFVQIKTQEQLDVQAALRAFVHCSVISVVGQRIRKWPPRPTTFVRADQRSEAQVRSRFLNHGQTFPNPIR